MLVRLHRTAWRPISHLGTIRPSLLYQHLLSSRTCPRPPFYLRPYTSSTSSSSSSWRLNIAGSSLTPEEIRNVFQWTLTDCAQATSIQHLSMCPSPSTSSHGIWLKALTGTSVSMLDPPITSSRYSKFPSTISITWPPLDCTTIRETRPLRKWLCMKLGTILIPSCTCSRCKVLILQGMSLQCGKVMRSCCSWKTDWGVWAEEQSRQLSRDSPSLTSTKRGSQRSWRWGRKKQM